MTERTRARRLARELLHQGTSGCCDGSGDAEATDEICRRFHQQFSLLVGSTSCDLLVARAVSIAAAEYPLFWGVHWDPGTGGLEGLRERLAGGPPEGSREACVAFLAAFLALLFSFFGAELTLRQVRRVWPDLPVAEAGAEARGEWRLEGAE